MSTTIRLSEEFHEKISEMAESSDKSMQEVMDSLIEDALESDDTTVEEVMTSLLDDSGDHDAESIPVDAIGRCPHTGEIFTEDDVKVDRRGRYVRPDTPNHIPVEELEPVDG